VRGYPIFKRGESGEFSPDGQQYPPSVDNVDAPNINKESLANSRLSTGFLSRRFFDVSVAIRCTLLSSPTR
jgi:hypothetical protein